MIQALCLHTQSNKSTQVTTVLCDVLQTGWQVSMPTLNKLGRNGPNGDIFVPAEATNIA